MDELELREEGTTGFKYFTKPKYTFAEIEELSESIKRDRLTESKQLVEEKKFQLDIKDKKLKNTFLSKLKQDGIKFTVKGDKDGWHIELVTDEDKANKIDNWLNKNLEEEQ